MFHYKQQAAKNEIFPAQPTKPYGVIDLRANYASTLTRALLMMSAAVSLTVLITWYLSQRPVSIDSSGQVEPGIIVIPFSPIDAPEAPKEPSKKMPAPKSTPATLTSTLVLDSIPETTEPEEKPDNTASKEPAVTGGSGGMGNDTTETNSAAKKGSAGGTTTTTLFDYEVTQLPEFEGGMAALMRFLQKNLRYPEPALSLGRQGKIHVRFVINERGKVTDVMLLNKLGDGLDEEAIRVVKLIPDFKSPAKLGGKPVPVYYSVPISFRVR
jgi:periplasmic protein TonB